MQKQRARCLAIASGTRTRDADESNGWFLLVTAMARVLPDENLALLKVVRDQQPDSMDTLARDRIQLTMNVRAV